MRDRLYQFENKLGNLEFDLETVQRELRDEGWKLVYIIDELDKLEEDKTKAILSVCKNFFTLSDAIFIFVGDEKSYEIGRENNGVLYERSREYTYFGSPFAASQGATPSRNADVTPCHSCIMLHRVACRPVLSHEGLLPTCRLEQRVVDDHRPGGLGAGVGELQVRSTRGGRVGRGG